MIAIGAIVAAFFFWDQQFPTALMLLGLGTAALFVAVLFPAVQDVEFGSPSGIRVKTALLDREQELTRAINAQKGDFTLYAQLLCADPALATSLLEAAWAKAAAEWREPVTPSLRPYVLCSFIHLLESHQRWADGGEAEHPASGGITVQPVLSLGQRTVVVLHEFAELPLAQIAAIVERPLEEVAADLRAARERIGRRQIEGGVL